MADETTNNAVTMIVEALREGQIAGSKALVTVGEIASEEIRSRQGKADASFGAICKTLREDVANAGGVGCDPSYLSRALATYAVANLLTDIDLVQQVPAYACKMVAPFVQRIDEAPADSPFNPAKELVYQWKEDNLADVTREFLTGVRDKVIGFLSAHKWLTKALAGRGCVTKPGGTPVNGQGKGNAKTTAQAIASGFEKALCTEVKDEKTGKVDAVRTRKACADGIKAAVQANVLSVPALAIAVKAAAARTLDEDEDTCLKAWQTIAEVAQAHVDALLGSDEDEAEIEDEELEEVAA